MVGNYLMYKNNEFDDYFDYYQKLDKYLANSLIQIEKDVDEFAYNYALKKSKELETNNSIPHYFIGSGNLYGMTYSHAMCYWEEQLWIHTKSISCEEFFHGCFEIIEENTPITLFKKNIYTFIFFKNFNSEFSYIYKLINIILIFID